jgi:hypothetical protein
MDSDAVAVISASIIALVLLVLYVAAILRERGQNPHWSAEVYLYYNPAAMPPEVSGDATDGGATGAVEKFIQSIAATYNAKIASIQQIEVYLVAGGGAHGYGYADGGAGGRVVVGAVPTGLGLGGLTLAAWPGQSEAVAKKPPSPVGVWLYGAKPRRGTRSIIPFSCAHWFQPV